MYPVASWTNKRVSLQVDVFSAYPRSYRYISLVSRRRTHSGEFEKSRNAALHKKIVLFIFEFRSRTITLKFIHYRQRTNINDIFEYSQISTVLKRPQNAFDSLSGCKTMIESSFLSLFKISKIFKDGYFGYCIFNNFRIFNRLS